jgi:hypothetical protein
MDTIDAILASTTGTLFLAAGIILGLVLLIWAIVAIVKLGK